MSSLNTVINIAILSLAGWFAYEYYQCAQTVHTYSPILVLPCMFAESLEEVVNATTCATANFKWENGDFIACSGDQEGSDNNSFLCQAFGIGENCHRGGFFGNKNESTMSGNADLHLDVFCGGPCTDQQLYEARREVVLKYIDTSSPQAFLATAKKFDEGIVAENDQYITLAWHNVGVAYVKSIKYLKIVKI